MDAVQAKKIGGAIAVAVALLIVGRIIYVRVAPSPEAQEFNNSADKINKKLDELKREQQKPSNTAP